MIKPIILALLLGGCSYANPVVHNDDGCFKLLFDSEWICERAAERGKKFERDVLAGDR